MIHISRRSNHVLTSLSIVTLSLALVACAGGDYASTDNGEGFAAQQQLDTQTMGNQSGQSGPLNASPTRGPQDPIYVNLAPPVLDKKMQEVEKPKGAVAQQIRKELSSDPIIQLVTGGKSATVGKSSPAHSVADVKVASKVSLMEMNGMNHKGDKDRKKMMSVVMEATITSKSPPAIYTVYESGQVLQNVEVSKRFAKQIRQVILEKVGLQIPAH